MQKDERMTEQATTWLVPYCGGVQIRLGFRITSPAVTHGNHVAFLFCREKQSNLVHCRRLCIALDRDGAMFATGRTKN